jgi:hypothetical protein
MQTLCDYGKEFAYAICLPIYKKDKVLLGKGIADVCEVFANTFLAGIYSAHIPQRVRKHFLVYIYILK